MESSFADDQGASTEDTLSAGATQGLAPDVRSGLVEAAEEEKDTKKEPTQEEEEESNTIADTGAPDIWWDTPTQATQATHTTLLIQLGLFPN